MTLNTRSIVVLLSTFLSVACWSTTTRSSPPATVSSTSANPGASDRAIALYAEAWAAYEVGEIVDAHRLTLEALASLNDETIANVSWPRLRLLRNMGDFCYSRLGQRRDARHIWKRASRASSLFHPMNTSPAQTAGGSWASAPSGTLAFAILHEKPLNFDVFRDPSRSDSTVNSTLALDGPLLTAVEVASTASALPTESANPTTSPEAAATEATFATRSPAVLPPVTIQSRLLRALALLSVGLLDDGRGELQELLQLLESRGLGTTELAEKCKALLAANSAHASAQASGHAPQDASSNDLDASQRNDFASILREEMLAALKGMLRVTDFDDERHTDAPLLSQLGGVHADRDFNAKIIDYNNEKHSSNPANSSELQEERIARGMDIARDLEAHRVKNADSLTFLGEMVSATRGSFPPDHPMVQEAQRRYSLAVLRSHGVDAYIALLESYLEDLIATIGADHSTVQSTRRQLAAEHSARGDRARAIELQSAALDWLRRFLGDSASTTVLARRELNEIEIEGSDLLTVMSTLREQARERQRELDPHGNSSESLASKPRIQEALSLRLQVVEMGRTYPMIPQDMRVEDLRDLASLWRALTRTAQAKLIEEEIDLVRSRASQAPTAAERDGSTLNVDGQWRETTPQVRISKSPAAGEDEWDVLVDIDEPSGVLAVDLIQDGARRRLDLAGEEWKTDPSGTRGQLRLRVAVPSDRAVSVIAVSVEGLRSGRSEMAFEILSQHGARSR